MHLWRRAKIRMRIRRRCKQCGADLSDEDVMKIQDENGSWETIPLPLCPDCFTKHMQARARKDHIQKWAGKSVTLRRRMISGKLFIFWVPGTSRFPHKLTRNCLSMQLPSAPISTHNLKHRLTWKPRHGTSDIYLCLLHVNNVVIRLAQIAYFWGTKIVWEIRGEMGKGSRQSTSHHTN